MIQSYLKIALRNLTKHKGYSFINIFGLAVGIACTMLICLYIAHELSYDRWNPNAERIVRPYFDMNFGGNVAAMAVSGPTLGPDALQELPEVQSYCRFRDYGSYLVKRDGDGQQNFREEHVLTVDSTFFELFPIKVLEGDARSCLAQPNSIAISKGKAEQYFGSAPLAMGQTLMLENRDRWKISAVFDEIPARSHFHADFLLSMNGNEEIKESSALWAVSNNFQTYLLLRPGVGFEDFREKFKALSVAKLRETASQLLGMTLEDFEATGQYVLYDIQALTDIHLHSGLMAELEANGNIQYIWIFGAIALFILLIACINFMNLTTARSAHRAKEIGVRKVLGGQRSSLAGQFLSESVLMAALAVLLALGIVVLALPGFSELASRQLELPWQSGLFWLALLSGIGLVGLLAGSYPAFFLSAFDSIQVLKGRLGVQAKHGGLRNGLVVFQFTTAVVLIIATLIVFQQLNYIRNKKIGFQKDQVIILNDANALGENVEAFKQELLKQPAVHSATISSYLPIPSSRSNTSFTRTREFRDDNSVNMQAWRADYDYLSTLGMELVKGRFFDRAFPSDSTAIVLNETAAKKFGFDDPIGKKVYTMAGHFQGKPAPEDFVELTIIGVVKDFNWASLRENIGALSLQLDKSGGLISFRYQADESENVIAALERNWKQMAPSQPFSYQFLDDSFAKMYVAEQRVGQIAGIFALLAILVSCLGLFGLASFMAEQRTKEIGVRKILGATSGNLVALLSRDFLKLVLLSILIAMPIGWWTMNQWLGDFAYRINIHWWVFAIAGVAAVAIAFLTVSFQSIKAALANPVKSLRSE